MVQGADRLAPGLHFLIDLSLRPLKGGCFFNGPGLKR